MPSTAKQQATSGIGFTFETALPGNIAQTHTWLTPPYILKALGTFDLDPCAAPSPRPWNTAKEHYDFSKGQDGLALPWSGRVWCNPPYGPDTGKWMKKLSEHGSGIGLIFARTETTSWQNDIWPHAKGILFLSGRIRFCTASGERGGTAGSPSALIAFSTKDAGTLATCGLKGFLVRKADPVVTSTDSAATFHENS